MKKTLLLALALAPALAFAQTSKITLGVKGAIGSAFATGPDQPKSSKFYTNYNAGVFATYSSSEHFAITIEAFYALKGAKGTDTQDGVTVTETAKRQYIDVPILFRYFVNDYTSAIRPNIFIGPSFNFLTGATEKLEGNGETLNIDAKNITPGFELSGVVGVCVNIRTAEKQWLNIDVRYNQGITNAVQNGTLTIQGQPVTATAGKYYNSSAMLSVGYGFGL